VLLGCEYKLMAPANRKQLLAAVFIRALYVLLSFRQRTSQKMTPRFLALNAEIIFLNVKHEISPLCVCIHLARKWLFFCQHFSHRQLEQKAKVDCHPSLRIFFLRFGIKLQYFLASNTVRHVNVLAKCPEAGV
jgi:hypothetical protein